MKFKEEKKRNVGYSFNAIWMRRVFFTVGRRNSWVSLSVYVPENINEIFRLRMLNEIKCNSYISWAQCKFVDACRMAIGLDQSRNAETMKKSKLVSNLMKSCNILLQYSF